MRQHILDLDGYRLMISDTYLQRGQVRYIGNIPSTARYKVKPNIKELAADPEGI